MKDFLDRRNFLSVLAATALGLLGLGQFGCRKESATAAPESAAPAEPEATAADSQAAPGMEMTAEQKKEYVFANCICGKCPSWVECGEKGGFCLVGKSECITEKKGCVCGECPVTAKMGLKWGYYCIAGDAMSMMKKEMEG